jgi:hypothetical protein
MLRPYINLPGRIGGDRSIVASIQGKARDLGNDRGYRVA